MRDPGKTKIKQRAAMMLIDRVLRGPHHFVEQPAGVAFPLADIVNQIDITQGDPVGRANQLNREIERVWAAYKTRGARS